MSDLSVDYEGLNRFAGEVRSRSDFRLPYLAARAVGPAIDGAMWEGAGIADYALAFDELTSKIEAGMRDCADSIEQVASKDSLYWLADRDASAAIRE